MKQKISNIEKNKKLNNYFVDQTTTQIFLIYTTLDSEKKIPDQYFSMIAVYFSIKVFEKIN